MQVSKFVVAQTKEMSYTKRKYVLFFVRGSSRRLVFTYPSLLSIRIRPQFKLILPHSLPPFLRVDVIERWPLCCLFN